MLQTKIASNEKRNFLKKLLQTKEIDLLKNCNKTKNCFMQKLLLNLKKKTKDCFIQKDKKLLHAKIASSKKTKNYFIQKIASCKKTIFFMQDKKLLHA